MRKFITIVESKESIPHEKEYAGSTKAKTAAGEFSKVTATITGQLSGKYTRMAKRFEEIDRLTKKLEEIRGYANDDAKNLVEELFDAEDQFLTRYVDTRSLVITMSKDQPKQTTQTEQFDVDGFVAGLMDLLDEELKPAVEALIKSHTKISTKTRAAQKGRISVKMKESATMDKIVSFVEKVKSYVMRRLDRFDNKFDKLVQQTNAPV